MKTWKNKLSAIILLACGCMGVLIDNDATALVLFALFAVPLFFAKKNWSKKELDLIRLGPLITALFFSLCAFCNYLYERLG